MSRQKRPPTTMEQVEEVRARLARGERTMAIAKAVGLSPTIVSKIKDGWRPSGGPKPPRLIPSRARQRGER
jgi:hypothetical protein